MQTNSPRSTLRVNPKGDDPTLWWDFFDWLDSMKGGNSVSNRDNEDLEPCLTVEDVFGALASECPSFVPTRWELLNIAQHWAKRALEIAFDGIR